MYGNLKSKLEVRLEAARLAVMVKGITESDVIEVSNKIADFIIGDADLPEAPSLEDPTDKLTKLFADIHKNTPAISPESKTE